MKLTLAELNVILEAVTRAEADEVDTSIYPDPDKYVATIASAMNKLRAEAAKRNAAADARAIARQQKKNADRVDGYDRDDMGESPDY